MVHHVTVWSSVVVILRRSLRLHETNHRWLSSTSNFTQQSLGLNSSMSSKPLLPGMEPIDFRGLLRYLNNVPSSVTLSPLAALTTAGLYALPAYLLEGCGQNDRFLWDVVPRVTVFGLSEYLRLNTRKGLTIEFLKDHHPIIYALTRYLVHEGSRSSTFLLSLARIVEISHVVQLHEEDAPAVNCLVRRWCQLMDEASDVDFIAAFRDTAFAGLLSSSRILSPYRKKQNQYLQRALNILSRPNASGGAMGAMGIEARFSVLTTLCTTAPEGDQRDRANNLLYTFMVEQPMEGVFRQNRVLFTRLLSKVRSSAIASLPYVQKLAVDAVNRSDVDPDFLSKVCVFYRRCKESPPQLRWAVLNAIERCPDIHPDVVMSAAMIFRRFSRQSKFGLQLSPELDAFVPICAARIQRAFTVALQEERAVRSSCSVVGEYSKSFNVDDDEVEEKLPTNDFDKSKSIPFARCGDDYTRSSCSNNTASPNDRYGHAEDHTIVLLPTPDVLMHATTSEGQFHTHSTTSQQHLTSRVSSRLHRLHSRHIFSALKVSRLLPYLYFQERKDKEWRAQLHWIIRYLEDRLIRLAEVRNSLGGTSLHHADEEFLETSKSTVAVRNLLPGDAFLRFVTMPNKSPSQTLSSLVMCSRRANPSFFVVAKELVKVLEEQCVLGFSESYIRLLLISPEYSLVFIQSLLDMGFGSPTIFQFFNVVLKRCKEGGDDVRHRFDAYFMSRTTRIFLLFCGSKHRGMQAGQDMIRSLISYALYLLKDPLYPSEHRLSHILMLYCVVCRFWDEQLRGEWSRALRRLCHGYVLDMRQSLVPSLVLDELDYTFFDLRMFDTEYNKQRMRVETEKPRDAVYRNAVVELLSEVFLGEVCRFQPIARMECARRVAGLLDLHHHRGSIEGKWIRSVSSLALHDLMYVDQEGQGGGRGDAIRFGGTWRKRGKKERDFCPSSLILTAKHLFPSMRYRIVRAACDDLSMVDVQSTAGGDGPRTLDSSIVVDVLSRFFQLIYL